ncbi:hypothetical protein F3Y22_tig00111199pilonHSYRG00023 [Hibiscus syriacus]|uniref:RNase H type-1 domain-containing protein n=1 Tax=Hibiscus syriacus TaxID=106335 RepID=A0A6A2YX28_HIBSY|nr:hypothetical protein F3Y22_tig00111199pilonHSYRG00023 [Hibiscus syriacus]
MGSWGDLKSEELKFNVDAAVRGYFGRARIRVLRDHNGKVLAKFSKYIGLSNTLKAELLSIWEACVVLNFSKWVDFNHVCIESDCLVVVNWLNQKGPTPAPFVVVVNQCKALCASKGWVVRFVFRE